MTRILIAILIALLPAVAQAQAPRSRPPLTGNIDDDIKNAKNALNPNGGAPADTGTSPCDYRTVSSLDPVKLIQQLKACIAVKGATDAQAALDSAKAASDTVALACLTPVVEILKAAEGTQTPATDPNAAPTFTAAGPIVLFQKFREFALAGGIPNCKSWVNTTIVMAAPIQ